MTLIIEMASGMRCNEQAHSRGSEGPVLALPRANETDPQLGLALVPVADAEPQARAMPTSLLTTDLSAFIDEMD